MPKSTLRSREPEAATKKMLEVDMVDFLPPPQKKSWDKILVL